MLFRFLLRFAMLVPVVLPVVLPVALPMVLSACGDLPEPFLGNPGATARRLAVPAVPMLAVPPPSQALLDPRADGDFADLLALSLQHQEVPTLAREPRKGDWKLAVTAERKGDEVVPRYAVLDPNGHEEGAITGSASSASGWTSGSPRTLGQAAEDAVPKIVALMMSIRATRDRADPNSLLHRVAKIYVPEVTGAPGDGNLMLTKQIRARLAEMGPLVQLRPDNADFIVKGTVAITPLPKGQQQVEIAWTVTRPSGVMSGKVSQLNAVPAGSLDQFWGDVAVVAAQEAAGGIDRVVERFIGREPAAPSAGNGKGPGNGSVPAKGNLTSAGSPPSGNVSPGPLKPATD